MKNKTFVFTAHRLSTIKCANKIVVMKEGQIIEYGTEHMRNSYKKNKNSITCYMEVQHREYTIFE